MKKLALAALAVSGLTALSGCNAIVLTTALASTSLTATSVSGALTAAPTQARVGYIAWIELMQDGTVQGKLNFDLVKDKTVQFDKAVAPTDGKFTMTVTPKAAVAEGTYVVFAWDDVNQNGIYEGDQGEKRAPEVYRVRGQSTTKSLWTTEKFVFTDKKLAIEYADQNGGLAFTFQ